MASSQQLGFKHLASLYRQILRTHREKLPGPLRALGDDYVAAEIRRHLKANTTPRQWQEFGSQWTSYVAMLNGTADLQDRSGDIPENVHASLNAQQREQLEKLQQAAMELARGSSPEEQKLDSSPLG